MQVAARIFLRNGVPGSSGHNSSQQPFMRSAPCTSVSSVLEPRVNVDEYTRELELAPRLAALYDTIGDPKREYVFNNWILMSLDFVRDRTRNLRSDHGQNDVVDFAFCYAGMGHAVVCSYVPRLDSVFYRVDGGGNGYEREAHLKALTAFKPSGGPTFFEVDHWFRTVTSQIGQEAYEPFNLPLTHLT